MGAVKPLVAPLVIIGAINWGLSALGFNIVNMIFQGGMIEKIIYLVIGAAGVLMALDTWGGGK